MIDYAPEDCYLRSDSGGDSCASAVIASDVAMVIEAPDDSPEAPPTDNLLSGSPTAKTGGFTVAMVFAHCVFSRH
jgi:hypothetical protein